MDKKIRICYFIDPELNLKLITYAKAKAQTRTEAINSIIEEYLSSPESLSNLKKQVLSEFIHKKDSSHWKRRTEYVNSNYYSKIKIIAKTTNSSISEVMNDILKQYLSKIDSKALLDSTLSSIFI